MNPLAMNYLPIQSAILAAALSLLSACGGGSANSEEDGLGRRPDTLSGYYMGKLTVAESNCANVPVSETVPIRLRVTQTRDKVVADESGSDYEGKALPDAYGFQVNAVFTAGGQNSRFTANYTGEGSKFNVTYVFTDKKQSCAGTYRGTLVYWVADGAKTYL